VSAQTCIAVQENPHGNIIGFGGFNAQGRISDRRSADVIGTTAPVPASHLEYGHFGFERAADR
jgi:hypothetical protein